MGLYSGSNTYQIYELEQLHPRIVLQTLIQHPLYSREASGPVREKSMITQWGESQ